MEKLAHHFADVNMISCCVKEMKIIVGHSILGIDRGDKKNE